jgi:hypothetical protein
LSAPDAPDRDERRAWLWAGLMVAVVTFAPFLRGIAAGSSFFFRDLSRYFFPMRLFALEGLRHGELRFWDPYDSEGIPLVVSWGYPLELLQALWPSPAGITFVMALHFPLAAIAFLVLARRLGLRPIAAAGGAIAYALGGCTSTSTRWPGRRSSSGACCGRRRAAAGPWRGLRSCAGSRSAPPAWSWCCRR